MDLPDVLPPGLRYGDAKNGSIKLEELLGAIGKECPGYVPGRD